MWKLILGSLLILAALAAMLRVLPEQTIGYFKDADHIAEERRMIERLSTDGRPDPDRRAQEHWELIRDMEDFRLERLQGIAIVGIGGTIAIVIGIQLIRSWRRGRAAEATASP